MLLQVEMYFPESGHPAFGIFRAIVKDSTDVNHGAASVVGVAPCAFQSRPVQHRRLSDWPMHAGLISS